jgi:hypothetical protein
MTGKQKYALASRPVCGVIPLLGPGSSFFGRQESGASISKRAKMIRNFSRFKIHFMKKHFPASGYAAGSHDVAHLLKAVRPKKNQNRRCRRQR